MRPGLAGVLVRFGREAVIVHGGVSGGASVFLQPINRRADGAPYQVTSLGTADNRQWLLLTCAPLADDDRVDCGGTAYTVRTCAPVYVGGALSHWRGVLEKRREAAD